MSKGKERLDVLLVERGLLDTRARARAAIMAGEVSVNGQRVDKAGTAVPLDATIELATPMPYVSRGGFKLAGALDAFGVAVAGRVCADVGACTGGFTDVLLQRGAARVFAIDVGQGQLDWKLRQDERVVVLEKTNARYLESLPQPIDLATIDVSFISLRLILPAVAAWLAPAADVVALVKPQFEAGPERPRPGGAPPRAGGRARLGGGQRLGGGRPGALLAGGHGRQRGVPGPLTAGGRGQRLGRADGRRPRAVGGSRPPTSPGARPRRSPWGR